MLVIGSNSSLTSQLLTYLHNRCSLRDLGTVSYFLGIQVTQHGDTLHLTQQKHIQDLLQKTQMIDTKPASTPGTSRRTLSQHDGLPLFDPSEYLTVVGALQYATITRPDIAFAVNKACQFMACPTDAQWVAVKRILRYLKGTLSFGLKFQSSSSLDLHGYSDADWASCPDDQRSTNGHCIFLGFNIISWSSSKQRLVSKSSAESEYCSLVTLSAELVWIQSLLK